MFAYVKFSGDTDFQVIEASRIHNFEPPVDTGKFYNIQFEDSFKNGVIAFVEGTKEELEEKISSVRPRVAPIPLLRDASFIGNCENDIELSKDKPRVLLDKKLTNDKLRVLLDKKLVDMTLTPVSVVNGAEELRGEQKKDKENVVTMNSMSTHKRSKASAKNKKPKRTKEEKKAKHDILEKQTSTVSTLSVNSTAFKSFVGVKISPENDESENVYHKNESPKNQSSNVTTGSLEHQSSNHRSGSLENQSSNERSGSLGNKSSNERSGSLGKKSSSATSGSVGKKSSIVDNRCQCTKILENLDDLRSELKKDKEDRSAFELMVTSSLQILQDNWKQIRSARESAMVTNELELNDITKPPMPGFIRSGENGQTVHCGQGIWIPKVTYDNAVKNARSHSQFVKNIALSVFGFEELKNSSVTGSTSNRTKSAAKPSLDATKSLAVRDIFRHYLTHEQKCSESLIQEEMAEYLNYIRGKISDMNRRSRTISKLAKEPKTHNINEKSTTPEKIINIREESTTPETDECEESEEGTESSENEGDSSDTDNEKGDHGRNEDRDEDDSGLT